MVVVEAAAGAAALPSSPAAPGPPRNSSSVERAEATGGMEMRREGRGALQPGPFRRGGGGREVRERSGGGGHSGPTAALHVYGAPPHSAAASGSRVRLLVFLRRRLRAAGPAATRRLLLLLLTGAPERSAERKSGGHARARTPAGLPSLYSFFSPPPCHTKAARALGLYSPYSGSHFRVRARAFSLTDGPTNQRPPLVSPTNGIRFLGGCSKIVPPNR